MAKPLRVTDPRSASTMTPRGGIDLSPLCYKLKNPIFWWFQFLC
jgi:hypothetical protein